MGLKYKYIAFFLTTHFSMSFLKTSYVYSRLLPLSLARQTYATCPKSPVKLRKRRHALTTWLPYWQVHQHHSSNFRKHLPFTVSAKAWGNLKIICLFIREPVQLALEFMPQELTLVIGQSS